MKKRQASGVPSLLVTARSSVKEMIGYETTNTYCIYQNLLESATRVWWWRVWSLDYMLIYPN